MNKLIKFLLFNAALGVLVSWLMLAAVLILDTWGLAGLVLKSDDGLLAAFMLAVGFGMTFGSAAMGTAVLMLDYENNDKNKKTVMPARLKFHVYENLFHTKIAPIQNKT